MSVFSTILVTDKSCSFGKANLLSLGSVYTPRSLEASDALAKDRCHVNRRCLAISTQREVHRGYAHMQK